MKTNQHGDGADADPDDLLRGLTSPDEAVRARAVRSLCPCRAGWQRFEEHLPAVNQLRKDPSPTVRANALHVFEDAAEMQNGGYPTNPREINNEMLRTRRASRFRPDEEPPERARDKRRRASRGGGSRP